ncbi:SDR family oxidoreductase [Sphingomonadales bacterium 56]|nr:SDR family oxidoreductase [Sphingomonadales bacterium 56]MBY2960155.1 SDR family oxidoreductase [Sphingomonadales bacterium 58]CAD7339943.1 3-oxoacyl-[acyl-carrier-protein] reductase FabG [Sphingobium sp. S6]CAD7340481.1 3-oxoacyl-[acyl-carrier-protein] reductase FabG [Sphingobium sp. S8]
MLDFTGKSVLVTGGGAGIGRACAEAFARQGARVFIAEIDPERGAGFTAGTAIQCDVTNPEQVEALAGRLEQETGGKLDILVNNVGHFLHSRPFSDLSGNEIQDIIGVNLISLMQVTNRLLPLLKAAAPGGSIINITSIEAYRGIPNCAVYAAAKSGITGFTKSLALELAPLGIRVNDIAPETTNTPQTPIDYMVPPENREHVERWVPLGRFGHPDDCAGAALYLASPLASWVTGTAIHVDGGSLAAAGWIRDVKGVWTNMPIVTGNGMNL